MAEVAETPEWHTSCLFQGTIFHTEDKLSEGPTAFHASSRTPALSGSAPWVSEKSSPHGSCRHSKGSAYCPGRKSIFPSEQVHS